MKYILSAGVITGFGTWQYDPISVEDAQAFVADGDFTSVIGYQETADVASEVLGVEVPMNRIRANLEIGDEALVIRPLGGTRIVAGEKGSMTANFIRETMELGLLKRL
jgi:Domain of unknown function (DUF1874)